MRDSWEDRLCDGDAAARVCPFPTFSLPQELCHVLRVCILCTTDRVGTTRTLFQTKLTQFLGRSNTAGGQTASSDYIITCDVCYVWQHDFD